MSGLRIHAESTGSTAKRYTDTETTPGIRHRYRIQAINPAGLSQWSSRAAVVAVAPSDESPQNAEQSQSVGNAQATGAPVIVGTVQAGETLTVDTSGISDEDGLVSATFTYQWIVTAMARRTQTFKTPLDQPIPSRTITPGRSSRSRCPSQTTPVTKRCWLAMQSQV